MSSIHSEAEDESQNNYLLGVFVRIMLVVGNVVAAWRTVIETGNKLYWLSVLVCSVLMMIEYAVVIFRKKAWNGRGATLPLVWEMQFKQRENYIASLYSVDDALRSSSTGGPESLVCNTTSTNTSSTTEGFGSSTTTTDSTYLQDISWRTIISISSDTWVILVNESLVFLIIFSRWLLPRGKIPKNFVADMLLEFFAIASDIMELLALFDEGRVRGDMVLNIWILTAWSISFIQFIPVLLHAHMYRPVQGKLRSYITEVLATSMSIVFQDGSFLVLRLYIMLGRNLVTHSLVCFVLKNIVSLLLLFYRMISLCR